MRAQFETNIISPKGASPKLVRQNLYYAIVANKNTNEQAIAIVKPYGVTFINEDGACRYSDKDWFDKTYTIIRMDEAITLTLRND